jgi:hypothetical protein
MSNEKTKACGHPLDSYSHCWECTLVEARRSGEFSIRGATTLADAAPSAPQPASSPVAAEGQKAVHSEPLYLVMAGGDGFQSSIVPESKLDDAYLLTQWFDLNKVSPEDRAETLEHFHEDDNWTHTDVTGNGERLEFSLHLEDGWIRVIRLFDTHHSPQAVTPGPRGENAGGVVEAQAVIAELVALKDLKDGMPSRAPWRRREMQADYDRRKPLAWAAARACATAWGLRIAEKGGAS